MKIQKGIVKYKDRNDIVCTYGVTEDGRQYYFLDENDSKKFMNGNRIATTALVEAIDPMVKASNVGVIDNDGNVVVMFDHRSIKPITDDIILAEKANPITQSVIDANNLRSDPSSATVLVSTPATIKERLNTQMGVEGRYVFNDQFSEATLYDINGNNLVNGEYYSFIANANDKLYMSKNTVDSVIAEFPLNSSNVYSSEAIDVNAVSVDQSVVEGALQQEGLNNDTMNDVNTGLNTDVQDSSVTPTSGVDNLVTDSSEVMGGVGENTMTEQMNDQFAQTSNAVEQNGLDNSGDVADTFFGVSEGSTNLEGNYPIPGDAVDSTVVDSMNLTQAMGDAMNMTGSMADVSAVEFGAAQVENPNNGFENTNENLNNSNGFSSEEIASDVMAESLVPDAQDFNSVQDFENNMVSGDVQSGLGPSTMEETSDMVMPVEENSIDINREDESEMSEQTVPVEEAETINQDIDVDNVGSPVEDASQSMEIDASTETSDSISQVEEDTSVISGEESVNNDSFENEDMPPIVEEEPSEDVDKESTEESSSIQDEEQDNVESSSIDDELISNSEVSQEDDSQSLISMNEDDFVASDSVIEDSETVDHSEEDEHVLENVDFDDKFEDVVNDSVSAIDDNDNELVESSKIDSYDSRGGYDYLGNKGNSIETTYYDSAPVDYYSSIPVRGSNQYSMYSDNYDNVFKSSMVKPDRIVTAPYNSYAGYKNPVDNGSIMSDVARSMAELMRQNKEQRGTILQYQEKLEEVESQRRIMSEKYNDQTLRVESLSNKLRTIDDASTRLETKNQMLEGRLREQEKIISAQERELNMLRPQLEGRQDLIKILADAKALLGADDEYNDDSYYGRRVA